MTDFTSPHSKNFLCVLQQIEMAGLKSLLCVMTIMSLLLSFPNLSETRPLQPPSTAISSMVKAIRALGESQAGSEGTAARAAYYASKRSSPGGPDPHHH
ncbi:hypothetical protein LINPERPRIM_LOCUS34132 [Linum perenne]